MGPSFWWGPTPFDFLYWNSYSPYGVNRSRPAPLRADKHLRTDIRAKECTNPARQARDAPPRARHVPRWYEEPQVLSFLASVSIPPPPPFRTKWSRRVPHPVLIGHAASLTP